MGRISGSNANILLAYAMEASLVEWSLFEDFLTLAQSANFSRAADLRHMTQPAFSRRIRSLEEWVGAPLFDRTCHPVALTEAGRRFLPAAQETLQRLDQVCEECRETARAASATLHFAATHSLSLAFFPSWLRDLEAAGPLGAIRLTSDSLQGCEQTMLQGLAQFLLCHHSAAAQGRLDEDRFQSVRVGGDTLAPLAAPGPGGARHTLDDRPVPFLAYSPESGLGRILAGAGDSPTARTWLEPVFTSHLAMVLRTMALEGRGVAWLPLSLAAEDLARGTLVRAGDPAWDVAVDIRLYRPRAPLAQAAERFWNLVAT